MLFRSEPSVTVTREMADELADTLLAKLTTPEMTQYEKAEAIFEYVKHHIKYVQTDDKTDWVKSAYEGLTRAKGDCFNYFAASKLLLTRAGIPNEDVERVGGAFDHYWNLVDVGTGYHHFDACPHFRQYAIRAFMMTDDVAREYSARWQIGRASCRERV